MVRFSQSLYDQLAERLNYSFRDHALLRHALTHSSTKQKQDDYQRLEFLGDRVLGLIIAEELFRLNPSHREGDMANLHSNLVRGEICTEVGKSLGLSDFITVGHSEQKKGMNLNASIVGDVVEAVIGGIYLDGGLDVRVGIGLEIAAGVFCFRNGDVGRNTHFGPIVTIW